MAEGIVYLDVDDEITSAAQRIRSAAGTRVALVVPYGSRIATSRMNFRLLSREAVMNNRRLSIVSGDAAARSLAASAGLPVFGSVPEYETAQAGPADESGAGPAAPAAAAASVASVASPSAPVPTGPRPGEARAGEAAAGDAAGLAASATVVVSPPTSHPPPADAPAARKSQRPKRPADDDTTLVAGLAAPVAAVPAPAARPGSGADRPAAAAPGSSQGSDRSIHRTGVDASPPIELPPVLGGRVRAPAIVAVGLIALALIVAGVGAYVFLPSASIALMPRREAIAPLEITVSADTEATQVDAAGARVPAIRLDVPVEAARTFTTTGVHVEETTARGSVTFTNYDFTGSGAKAVPSGSVVSTEGGTKFQTTASVFLGAATRVGSTIVPTQKSVEVRAVRSGTQGNVPANAIRIVPPGQDPSSLSVNNPADTTGGSRRETPEVSQAEVDKALAGLQADLAKAFEAAIVAGAGAPPETTLFPQTAVPGAATPDPDPKTLVGQAVETFDLKLTATGTVIAVDPRPVETIARTQLQAKVDAGHRLIEDSVAIDVGEGSVGEDGQVTFQAIVQASEVRIVDAASLPALVKGKTKADAEAALATFGTATVTLWPDWVTTVTTVDARLSVTVADAAGGSGPTGSPSPGSSPPRASPVPARSAPPASTRPAGSAALSIAP
jgi:baseplate J-like protein